MLPAVPLPSAPPAALGAAADTEHGLRPAWVAESGGVLALHGGDAVHGATLRGVHAVPALVPEQACSAEVSAGVAGTGAQVPQAPKRRKSENGRGWHRRPGAAAASAGIDGTGMGVWGAGLRLVRWEDGKMACKMRKVACKVWKMACKVWKMACKMGEAEACKKMRRSQASWPDVFQRGGESCPPGHGV